MVSSGTERSTWSRPVFSRSELDMTRRARIGALERREKRKGFQWVASRDSRLEVKDVEKNDRYCDTMRDIRVYL